MVKKKKPLTKFVCMSCFKEYLDHMYLESNSTCPQCYKDSLVEYELLHPSLKVFIDDKVLEEETKGKLLEEIRDLDSKVDLQKEAIDSLINKIESLEISMAMLQL